MWGSAWDIMRGAFAWKYLAPVERWLFDKLYRLAVWL